MENQEEDKKDVKKKVKIDKGKLVKEKSKLIDNKETILKHDTL